eukprot:gene19332-25196_t
MPDGSLEVIKKDYSKEVKEAITESNAIVSSGKSLEDAIQLLLSFEKQCRVSLTDGQEKELLQTLMSICDGKMYLEAESARIHMSLAHIYEKEGDLIKACEYIQDVHVETYGSLSKLEKAEYILDQIRLNLLNKDYIRALLQSRKMNRKTIEEETWDISQSYYKLFEAYTTKSDSIKARVIEHNIRVIAKAYSRINLSRLANLLNLPVGTIEESLSEISQSGFVSIKINRSEGIVSFESSRSNEEILSDYGSDVAKLLHLMESTCHLIRRENM